MHAVEHVAKLLSVSMRTRSMGEMISLMNFCFGVAPDWSRRLRKYGKSLPLTKAK
ncbi:MAG: hypothetical protein HZC24_00255 [Rhodocyclales bacterium]|nr:hypothetical protein [Rhodocyclales bacterium]